MSTFPPVVCPECRRTYTPKRWDQAYCSKVCGGKANNREQLRGRRIYHMAYHWRHDRKNSKDQLRELCREIASWIEEDKTVGRPVPRRFDPKRRGHVTNY